MFSGSFSGYWDSSGSVFEGIWKPDCQAGSSGEPVFVWGKCCLSGCAGLESSGGKMLCFGRILNPGKAGAGNVCRKRRLFKDEL